MKTKTKAKKTSARVLRGGKKRADAAQERAAELADLAEKAGEIAQERARLLAARLRESDALSTLRARGGEMAGIAQVKGGELATLAKAKWHESDLDARAAALSKQLREASATKEASKRAREVTDATLAALGGWIGTGTPARKLNVTRKPRVPGWVWGLLGTALGFAAARMMSAQNERQAREDLAEAAQRLAEHGGEPTSSAAGAPMSSGIAPAASSGIDLADEVRSTLQEDPRTSDLRELDINVAEGTVFVRGSLPSGIDSSAVRQVIERVPGVRDVDLQLTTA